MNIQTDRALVAAGAGAVRYCTVTITAPNPPPAGPKSARPPARVALVIDRSGSMAESKLAMAKKAVDHAMRLLHDHDHLALVCYDDRIDVLLAGSPATAEAKTLAITRLRGLDARGNTNLAGGWQAGAAELGDAGRVLLLSDGLANEGETNPDTLAATAAALRARGIVTSTFGVGADFDERLMSRLATSGGGHFYFIEHAAQIPDLFTSELGEALHIVAHDARLIVRNATGTNMRLETTCLNDFPVEFSGERAARANHANGVRQRSPASERVGGPRGEAPGSEEDGLHVRIGDLSAGQQISLVLATRIPPLPVGETAAISLHLADADQALFAGSMDVSWRVVANEDDKAQPVNRDVVVAAAVLVAERARAEALEFNRAGAFDRAENVLATAIAHLRAMAPDIPAVQTLATELEGRIPQYMEEMAPMMLKQEFFQSYTAQRSRDSEGKGR